MYKNPLITTISILLFSLPILSKDYFVHPKIGNDKNTGLSKKRAFQSLERLSQVKFSPGDQIFLAANETYFGSLVLSNVNGTVQNPILITSILWDKKEKFSSAIINFKSFPNGVLIEDASFLILENIQLTGNGYEGEPQTDLKMRCGVLVTSKDKNMTSITIRNLKISEVYFENEGFSRGEKEVKTENGTQKYGWGIRVINQNQNTIIDNLKIEQCHVEHVSHTGIKFTGKQKNISNCVISKNKVFKTGGPGIQMSEVKNMHVFENFVSNTGNKDDSRKWGRGSGLWTWGASHVLIEKNKFLYANGPGDSAGAHIDFNCDHIIIQYNLSAYNAGGFCEILGNNYNCAYRYNISVNDGFRKKGENGAFQEGKTLWLSGYQGQKKARKGPVNSYVYNNTIYTDATIHPKIAFDNTSRGFLLVNNIFYAVNPMKVVLGDQYKADEASDGLIQDLVFKNNLFLNPKSWPTDFSMQDEAPIYGNPEFANLNGLNLEDFIPKNQALIKNKGILIPILPNDTDGLFEELPVKKDILGNDVPRIPSLGAIEP